MMPNYVTNHLLITHKNATTLAAIPEDFDFNHFLPMPEELESTGSPQDILGRDISKAKAHSLMERYGAISWYDWRIANWGTKSNALNVEELPAPKGYRFFNFETAWEQPASLLLKLEDLGFDYDCLSFDECLDSHDSMQHRSSEGFEEHNDDYFLVPSVHIENFIKEEEEKEEGEA